jgi:hypothetical protein
LTALKSHASPQLLAGAALVHVDVDRVGLLGARRFVKIDRRTERLAALGCTERRSTPRVVCLVEVVAPRLRAIVARETYEPFELAENAADLDRFFDRASSICKATVAETSTQQDLVGREIERAVLAPLALV